MSRALVTFALGEHERLLELSLPRMAEYADRHGYELQAQPPLPLMPASWMKVATLITLLHEHEAVLWLDCDVVVCDLGRDIADEIPADAWQAMVAHHTADGEVPNCGVWYVRSPMLPWLTQLWQLGDEYRDDPWWEQGALLSLLGYCRRLPVQRHASSELYDNTHWLGLEWNSHEQADRHPAPRFAHATYGPLDWRIAVMREHLARSRGKEQHRWASTS